MNALVYVDIDHGIHKGKIQAAVHGPHTRVRTLSHTCAGTRSHTYAHARIIRTRTHTRKRVNGCV